MHGEDAAYAVGGAVAPLIAALLGWIPFGDIMTGVVMSGVGAATAWLVKEGLTAVKNKLKKK